MKIKSITAMLIVFGVFFNATGVSAQLGVKTVAVDKAKFTAGIKKSFDGNVKGYQAILLKDGKIYAEVAGGDARNQIDGQADMIVNTPSNIGSTAKFFAGVALLKFFQTPKGNLNPYGKTVDQWLDTEIFPYLPAIWRANADKSWKEVTFRQLLQHKSGVRALTDAERNAFVANGYRTGSPFIYLLKPIKDADRNKRDYENFNFTILTYLLPAVSSLTLSSFLDNKVAKEKLKVDDLAITQLLGDEFEKHLRNNSFGKITPKINPSCDAPNEYPKQNRVYAMAYNSVADATKGFEWSEREQNGSCYAQGGWYLSGRELAAFAANFDATETLVSDETKAKMFDEKKADDRLVWSTFAFNAWIKENLGVSRMPRMDGGQDGYSSVFIKMPNGFFAVAIANSADTNADGLAAILLESFSGAASL